MSRTKGSVAVKECRPVLEPWMLIEACARSKNYITPYKIWKWINAHYVVPADTQDVSDMAWSMRGDVLEWTWTPQGQKTNNWYRIHPAYYPQPPFPDPYTAEERTAMLECIREEELREAEKKERQRKEKAEYDRRRNLEKKRIKVRSDNIDNAPEGGPCCSLEDVETILRTDPEKVLVIDTETTGLSRITGDVLELAVLDFTGRVLFNRRFGSALDEWDEAQYIHGISPADVAGLPELTDSAAEISAVLAGASVIIGYNVDFDIGFLEAAGVALPPAPCCDIMESYAEYYGEWAPWIDNGPYPPGDWKWQKLTKAARKCGVKDTSGAHGAAVDCALTITVTRYLLDVPAEKRHREPPPDEERFKEFEACHNWY